jgi:hypothetical protein
VLAFVASQELQSRGAGRGSGGAVDEVAAGRVVADEAAAPCVLLQPDATSAPTSNDATQAAASRSPRGRWREPVRTGES